MNQPLFSFETATTTHPGRVRKINEDSIYASAKRGIWLVADGMGGHRDGNIASAMIADAAASLPEGNNIIPVFFESMMNVNRNLLARSNGASEEIVGSTLNALIVVGSHYTCLWAGDSRCYLIRGGKLTQISQDHTEVQELVNRGVITKEEARTWPRRNVITRALGAHQDLDIDVAEGEIRVGDCFVVCSDGLTGHVTDAEILANTSWSTAQIACDRLLEMALERGGKDNISIIVVRAAKPDRTRIRDLAWNES